MRPLPSLVEKWLLLFVAVAGFVGILFDFTWGTRFDDWLHDMALVFQKRNSWQYTAVVVLDEGVPLQVGRKQALPLFARAAENLIDAGAKGVFLDARVPKLIEGVMPYALCIETDGAVRWSNPVCRQTDNRCQIGNSPAGNAPLKMKGDVFPYFRIAPYLVEQTNLPDFLLYGWEAEAFIPKNGLVVSDRLAGKDSAIARWLDLSPDHAAVVLAGFIDSARTRNNLVRQIRETCNGGVPCRRIRFSMPGYAVQWDRQRPVFPVSRLASCDAGLASEAAAKLKNRVIIFQVSAPTESTDVIVTPVTTALFGPHLLTPGAQYLADAVETILNNDHPRAPPRLVRYSVFVLAALLGVYVAAYLRQYCLWCAGLGLFTLLAAFCFLWVPYQLWPVAASMAAFLTGALLVISVHLLIGFREGNLILKYMPRQVHDMLLMLRENENFQNQRYEAVVLMSDMTGYTTVTEMLKEPGSVLELMNDYLEATSFVLQDKYQGWLETYIGDMVCYYWPYRERNKAESFRHSLAGALELAALQKRFFSDFSDRYRKKFDDATLANITKIMDAGIGLSSGSVIMGDLGPKRGVRKFGILGDPMNLTARIESLTRYFNCEIIATGAFLQAASGLNVRYRRLGCFCVKGRDESELLYAFGDERDVRFREADIALWEQWLARLESGDETLPECPSIYLKDQNALLAWKNRGLLRNGVWHLDEK